jgi:CRISPR/Cas system-associated exonuclease Cas4 (RecB family)
MTEKQTILMNYLLNRLGFQESDYRDEYVEFLTRIAFIHKGIAAIEEKDWDEGNPKPYYYFDDEYERYLPKYFTIVDFLIWENKLKKERNFKVQEKQSNYISATDLANYTYCPVGYSIGKTYLTPKNHLGEIGTKKHEEHRLIQSFKAPIDKVDITEKEDEEPLEPKERPFKRFIKSDNEKFFDDINNSELIFSGHSTNDSSNEYFINKEKMFIGQPDYIFKNKDGKYFVIEEKFKRHKESNQNFFFRNHKVQLASYIYFIDKYKIEYGYLVYWLYDYSNYYFEVEDCNVLKLNRTQSAETFVDSAHKAVNTFNERKFFDLDLTELNSKKCANCVYILLCGHKNKRNKQVTIPYQSNYFNLFGVEYPEELKKENDENKNSP